MKFKPSSWLAPKTATLPDFIIAGAMKSGTTTLHAILNQHPDIFIPDDELHFFDMDNIVQHADFNFFEKGRWHCHDLSKSPEHYWRWYSQKFQPANAGVLLGEDSTTYLASETAIKRIAQQNKNIKLIIMLRQPTARAYSHYWHMVQAGRAMFSFEDMLKISPLHLVNRSDYFKQLSVLFNYVDKKHVKVVLFEDFLDNKKTVLSDVCDFLNIDFNKLPVSAYELHKNKTKTPRYLALHLFMCRLFGRSDNNEYIDHFMLDNKKSAGSKISFLTVINKLHRLINPLVEKKAPKINASTKKLLDDYFYNELQGLDELLQQDIMSKWFD